MNILDAVAISLPCHWPAEAATRYLLATFCSPTPCSTKAVRFPRKQSVLRFSNHACSNAGR